MTAVPSIAPLVDAASLVVTCGPGGVGKTTTAAAIGVVGARAGRRTVVVTIDPARRLADALGLAPGDADDPHRVRSLGSVQGTLDVLMLDAERTFDRLIVEHAPERADAILGNRVYRSIAGSFAGAQEYLAIERLHQLADTGDHDLIVVDTPPSRHAVDILAAPERLDAFLGHPVYRTLTIPGRSMARVTNTAATAFSWTVRRLAGPQIVEDTIEFFRLLSGLEDGLRARARAVSSMLRDPSAAFVLVSSPRAEAIDEAVHLRDALRSEGYPLGATIANMVHPLPPPCDFDAAVPSGSAFADQLAYHHELTALATAERAELAGLWPAVGTATDAAPGGTDGPVQLEVPLLDHDVHGLDTLTELADLLAP